MLTNYYNKNISYNNFSITSNECFVTSLLVAMLIQKILK